MIQDLIRFAKLSAEVYGDLQTISLPNQTNKNIYDKNGTQAVSISTPEYVVIIFRGTEPTEMADIAADLKTFQTKGSLGKGDVHVGFKDALDEIWEELNLWVTEHKHNKKIITCGHSLGGALATLCASRLSADLCYTYGSPKVGDSNWVSGFTTKHYRVVNNNDIVPKVPLYLMGYRHTCDPVYLSYTGKISRMTFIQRIIDSVRGRLKAMSKLQFFDSIYDHNISEYIRFLKVNITN